LQEEVPAINNYGSLFISLKKQKAMQRICLFPGTFDPVTLGHVDIETIFLTGEPKYTSVASTIVRDIIRNHGDVSHFLPKIVFKTLKK
jgi:phosphopantetheine adenylyltransferase